MRDGNSVWHYLAVITFIIGIPLFYLPRKTVLNKVLCCKEFKQKSNKGKIERIVILPEQMVGLYRDSLNRPNANDNLEDIKSGPMAPWRLGSGQLENQLKKQFMANRLPQIEDPQLLKELDGAKVDYRGKMGRKPFPRFYLELDFSFDFVLSHMGIVVPQNIGSKAYSMLNLSRNKPKIHAEYQENQARF